MCGAVPPFLHVLMALREFTLILEENATSIFRTGRRFLQKLIPAYKLWVSYPRKLWS